METKKPGGRGSSGPVLQRVLSFSFLFGLFLHGTVGIASADATLTVKLPKLPGAANPVLISVRAVEAETAQLLASISLKKKSSQVQLKVKALPQVVFADLFTSDGNHFRSHSHVLRPVDRKKMTVTLELESGTPKAADFSEEPFSPSAETAWPPADRALVGVPSSGFAVEGIDLTPRDVTRMLTTDLAQVPCYNEAGGFVAVVTDPEDLAIVQAEIDFSNSSSADPSTRLQNLYVPPSYSVNGSWSSDGTTLTVTYRLVDSQGTELQSRSGTGSPDDFLDVHSKVAKELTNALCCKSKKVKCAKTGSIDIDEDYDIPDPDCPRNHQSYQGNIKFTLNPVVTDPENACEYSGGGTSQFKSDSDCVEGVFLHVTCTIAESIVGRVPKPVFPSCGPLVVDFEGVWNCTSVDNLGTQTSTFSGTFSETFQYKNGYVLELPLDPSLVGHARFILHLK